MHSPDSRPWTPDHPQAYAIITVLLLMILGILGLSFSSSHRRLRPPQDHITFQGRIQEWTLAFSQVFQPGRAPKDLHPEALETLPPWDQAMASIFATEQGQRELGRKLAAASPTFQACWQAAYEGAEQLPLPAERAEVKRALGNGYASKVLEARLEARQGKNTALSLQQLRSWLLRRILALAALGICVLALMMGGLVFIGFLAKTWKPIHLAEAHMPGRTAIIVLLAWFLAFLLSGNVAATLLHMLPVLRPAALPLTYALHAALGIALLCRAEGISPADLWRRLTPRLCGRHLLWGVGFLAMATITALTAAIASGPFLPNSEPPQRNLMELISGSHGFWAPLLLLGTLTVLAPLFEETLFRGFLLPYLQRLFSGKLTPGQGRIAALVLSSLAFGAIHLQPAGLPVLSALGLVLGLAYIRTGSLWVSIGVHSAWNGGIFLLLQLL